MLRCLTLTLLSFISCLFGTESLSLAGSWRFAMDRNDQGITQNWPSQTLKDSIELPGILQAQGFGDEISPDTPWVLGLGGEWWKQQPDELRAHFSQPGQVEVPFLSQPRRHYLGVAWYQRDLEIPQDWAHQRIELFLERPRWESTVWIDDQNAGSARSLVAPHSFDLGPLPPGKHTLTIRLDNRMIVRDPAGNEGHMPDAHAVSDALGQTWNGIAGKIELRVTPQVWIKDLQAFPSIQPPSARIVATLGNATSSPGKGTLRVGDFLTEVTWQSDGGLAEFDLPLPPDTPWWSEFHPHLIEREVVLETPAGIHRKTLQFGLREVRWEGKELLVNDRPTNLRTTHFGLDFPLTGYPATDVKSWKRIIRRCQEFGLNGIRFHSCCPPDAAFTAADELGFFLQAECGLWAPFFPGGVYTQYLEEETALLLKAYGNHPSFLLFSPSNEPSGRYTEVTPEWAQRWHQRDPRHLYAAGTGWNRPEQVFNGPQFAGLVRFGKGELRNETGWFGNDFRQALEDVEIPILAHEIGQWCAYPDFSVIDKFTGYLRPSNYDIFRWIAQQNGLLDQNAALAHASGKFQLACYKEELEANLRTPGLAGHQMLDIRDYLGQGTALIGVLDAFWDPKSYVTAEAFRRFHSATVPLARLKQRTFTTTQTFEAETELYHFGPAPLKNTIPYWEIRDASGQKLLGGEGSARDFPIGKNLPLDFIQTPLDALPAPGAYRLVVGLRDQPVENDWNFWLYPADAPLTPQSNLLISSDWDAAETALSNGKRVLFTPGKNDLDPALSPPMRRVPIFWNIQMTVRPPKNPTPRFDAMLGLLCDPEHPALAEFPTEAHADFQWTSIVHGVRSISLNQAPTDLRPIVMAIDDWNRNWRLGVIFECSVGPGKLLVSAIPLERADPVTRQLRHSLVHYATSDDFQPKVAITPANIRSLFRPDRTTGPAPKRTFDPDLDDGSGPR
ncbi:hypothetical protein HNR46_002390 [Haloferula luteola]|uniref:Beta-glucuronidase n=1 Tax=Haloferula luteola TaxID=595692 RepID=A0A840VE95_9BACT|nr:sugar-binding domain-containing protein [Haloferula luteola]MBB5352149.1 hypothetical protein [Haloferula luteola]